MLVWLHGRKYEEDIRAKILILTYKSQTAQEIFNTWSLMRQLYVHLEKAAVEKLTLSQM